MKRIYVMSLMLVCLVLIWLNSKLPLSEVLTTIQPHPLQCSPGLSEKLYPLIELAKELKHPGLQVSYRDSQGNWVHCASGWASWKGFGTKMTIDHRMRFYSLSKLMTSSLAIILSRNENFNLGLSLIDLLDMEMNVKDQHLTTITMNDLLRHRAGFDRSLSGDPMMNRLPWCPNDMNLLAEVTLDYPPNTKFAYSNLGYCLAGEGVSRRFKKSLELLIGDYLLKPLRLEDAIVTAKRGIQFSDEAALKVDTNEQVNPVTDFDFDSMHATGAWTGSAKALGRLMEQGFIDEDGLLSDDERTQLTAVNPDCDISIWRHCHGLAMYQYAMNEKKIMNWRDGSMPGGTAFLAVSENNEIIIWLSNSRTTDWIKTNDRIGQKMYHMLNEWAVYAQKNASTYISNSDDGS